MQIAVFHRIGTPNRETFTNSLEQILNYNGVVTFDGVYTSVYEHREALSPLMPLLFITGDNVGKSGYCTREQLEEMRDLGFTLGWHGWNHERLPFLSEREIRAQLKKPEWIDPIYAYPHGDFDELSIQILKEMGYATGYSTTQGNSNHYSLQREYI